MIYLFVGDDVKNKNISYEKFIKFISGETEIFFISRNDFDKVQIESFYSGSSLFSSLNTVVFDGVLEREETRDYILDKLGSLAQSSNTFVFLDSKLDKLTLDVFKKTDSKKCKINIFELPKEKKEKFNNFLITNAFEKKDKLNMWIYFREAMNKGVAMEELVGVLFWRIKDMVLKKDFRKFSQNELTNFASSLSYLLPQARKAGRDAESAFEQFLLEAF